ncbi:hypothetical protein EC9_30920 [Rosistilla ulvae]|uniref:Uncharacterized protein n=1 Tax=Rosistilla ulvae TaxID=1930277 RepID=A0A517M203_9BACT|nr:hypothetical protein [Rosistilla ulvae]QDS88897.1 hypothetical protein EC9_30920 [Rosistilla ulvae]
MKRKDFSDRHLLKKFKQDLQRKGFEKAVGAKFLYYRLKGEYADRFNAPALRDVQQYILQNRRLRIVHLTRRNVLRTVISMIAAPRPASTVLMIRRNCLAMRPSKSRQKTASHDFKWCATLKQKLANGFLTIPCWKWYMKTWLLIKIKQQTVCCVFLNVDRIPVSGRMVRQSKSLLDSVLNYDELAGALAGTEWGSMLTDDVV